MIRIRIKFNNFEEVKSLVAILQDTLPGHAIKRTFRKDGSGCMYLAPKGQFEKDKEWIKK